MLRLDLFEGRTARPQQPDSLGQRHGSLEQSDGQAVKVAAAADGGAEARRPLTDFVQNATATAPSSASRGDVSSKLWRISVRRGRRRREYWLTILLSVESLLRLPNGARPFV